MRANNDLIDQIDDYKMQLETSAETIGQMEEQIIELRNQLVEAKEDAERRIQTVLNAQVEGGRCLLLYIRENSFFMKVHFCVCFRVKFMSF